MHEKTNIGTYFVAVQQRERWLVLALILLLLVGGIDYVTDYWLKLVTLYLPPLLAIIWFTGLLFGLFFVAGRDRFLGVCRFCGTLWRKFGARVLELVRVASWICVVGDWYLETAPSAR